MRPPVYLIVFSPQRLHREKLKLYEKGQLPENVNLKNRTRGEDYDDRLRDAISEILNGKSQNEVAKRYNIPKTTIWRIIKKVDPSYKDSGVIITPDSEIVEQLLQLSKKRSSVIIKLEYADEDAEENVEMSADADEKSPIK
jgi:predicted transcriptional regulator